MTFKKHIECPKCGSSDGRALYSDGTSYCFVCTTYFKSEEQEEETRIVEETTEKEFKKLELEPLSATYTDLTDRGISKGTAERYKVHKSSDSYFTWCYPLFRGHDHVANKFRVNSQDKRFQCEGEMKKAELFGQNVFPAGSAKQITVCEGYDDAMAAYEMFGSKYPFVSVHSASTAAHDVANSFEYLNAFDEIVICFDRDEGKKQPDGSIKYPGQDAALQVAGMFPLGKVRILTLQREKDANDYLKKGLGKQFQEEWWKAPKYTPQGLKLPKDMWNEVSKKKNTESVPYPWEGLNAFTYGIRLSEFHLFTAETGVGKALALDTPIPTPSGWTTMGELKVGDSLFDEKGRPCKIIFTTDTQLNRECYKINFDDGSEIIADKDHLWVTSTKKERDKKLGVCIRTTEEIKNSLIVNGGRANHAIDVSEPIYLPDETLEIPPYTFGTWLGDGSSSTDIIWSDDPETLDYVLADGFNVSKTSVKFGYKVHGLREKLKLLGVLGKKHIPDEYLRASINQRMALLQGLMDTDGHCATGNKTCEITQVNEKLAYQIFELVVSLGIKARFKVKRAVLKGKDCGPKYVISFTTRKPVFKLSRKLNKLPTYPESTSLKRYIKDVEPISSVPVKCIQVNSPSNMYLCGKQMIPTHNTSVVKEIEYNILQEFLKGNIKGKLGLLHLEEQNEDTLMGLMSINADRPLHIPDVRETVAEEELHRYFTSVCDNDGMVIWDHFGSNSVDAVLAKIRHMHNLGCKYIFFDHLSIVVSDQSGDERKQLDEISTKLKTLCVELDIAVIGVIHQNRQGFIRGSAGPEQLANMVIKLYRDKEADDPWRRNVTKLVVQKNRFCGRTGPCCYLEYVPESGRLVELTKEQIMKYESGKPNLESEDGW